MKGKLWLLILVSVLGSYCAAQELPDSPKPKLLASQMSKANRDAYLCQKYGCDKPVDSIKHALLAKDMLPWEILYVAANVLDEETTQSCIHRRTCVETNPLLGQSRAQAYVVGGALSATALLSAAYLRKHNHGTWAKALLYVPALVHVELSINTLRSY